MASDSTRNYLSSIGRVPLLTPAVQIELIELAHHVQAMKELLEVPEDERTPRQRHRIRMGKRARGRMMAINLRLVVSVAKKYQNQGLELLDLVQEGAIGLERAVDKFDPAGGYRFSTYAFWMIRQGMTRALDKAEMRRITHELSHRFGRQPNRLELANAMGIEPRDLVDLIAQSAPCASLDAHARGEEDRSTLGELIPDPNGAEPMEGMDRSIQKEHLGGWLSQLNEREQKILKLLADMRTETPAELDAPPSLFLRTAGPIEIFFSYAHEDEALMDTVRLQLVARERIGEIVKWHDRMIPRGDEWQHRIDERIERADVIVLFMSPHFLASCYCYEIEGQIALRRHREGTARVIPVILRACDWTVTPFGELQALPRDGVPLTQWDDRDQASLEIARGIMASTR